MSSPATDSDSHDTPPPALDTDLTGAFVCLQRAARSMVAAGRGVSVLPDWVLQREAGNPDLVTLPLGPSGVTRRPKRTESNLARLLEASAGRIR